jgi:hypothetical protein
MLYSSVIVIFRSVMGAIMLRRAAVSLALVPWLLGAAPIHAQSLPSSCQFILGFGTLHNMDAADVGNCTDNQTFAANGDAQQHTTNGLMAWRKADNWTAFTNGYWTWINGPNGLAKRLNTQRFSWEANPTGLPVVGATIAATAALPAANGQDWSIAFDHTTTMSSDIVSDDYGNNKTLYPTGKYLVIYFSLRSNEKSSDSVNSDDFTLTDAQGRNYTSDYQVREVAPDGSSAAFDDASIAPGATVALKLTFDVAKDASGLVLHLQDGNDVSVQ